jgi:hypothetical protein
MRKAIRLLSLAAMCAAALQLTGCVQMKLSPPQPTVENVTKLRNAEFGPVAVGTFKADAGKPASFDKSVSMRGSNSMSSPIDDSFAAYLQHALKAELESARLFDAAAGTVITGTLTINDLDPAISTARGALGARFVVTRAGTVRFDRVIQVSSSWSSSLMADIAISRAAMQYGGLYGKLIGALADDEDFRKAISKN